MLDSDNPSDSMGHKQPDWEWDLPELSYNSSIGGYLVKRPPWGLVHSMEKGLTHQKLDVVDIQKYTRYAHGIINSMADEEVS